MKTLLNNNGIAISLGSDCTIYVDDLNFSRRVFESDPNEAFGAVLDKMSDALFQHEWRMRAKWQRVERYDNKRELAKRAIASAEVSKLLAKEGAEAIYTLLELAGCAVMGYEEYGDRGYVRWDYRQLGSAAILGWLL